MTVRTDAIDCWLGEGSGVSKRDADDVRWAFRSHEVRWSVNSDSDGDCGIRNEISSSGSTVTEACELEGDTSVGMAWIATAHEG